MERCKSLVKNFERTLANATTQLNLCFVRLMLKRLASRCIEISNGFYKKDSSHDPLIFFPSPYSPDSVSYWAHCQELAINAIA